MRVVSDAKAACHRERCTCGGLTCGYRCGGRQTLVSSWAKNSAERRRERSLHEKEIETLGVFLPHASLCCTQAWLLLLLLSKPLCHKYLFIYLCCWSIFRLFSVLPFPCQLNSFKSWTCIFLFVNEAVTHSYNLTARLQFQGFGQNTVLYRNVCACSSEWMNVSKGVKHAVTVCMPLTALLP